VDSAPEARLLNTAEISRTLRREGPKYRRPLSRFPTKLWRVVPVKPAHQSLEFPEVREYMLNSDPYQETGRDGPGMDHFAE
jgi:hypothetical protein